MSNISKRFLLSGYRRKSPNLEVFNLVIFIIVLIISLLVISFLSQLRAYAEEVPTEESIREILGDRGENSKIFDRNGKLLYTFKDPEMDREYVDYEDIPPSIIAAALAAEDKNFYIHEGLDYIGLGRGLVATFSSGGDNKIGGSTITQQLVKQSLLTNDRTFDRKAKEAIITLIVERDYSKEEIMEYYLNVSNFGGRVHGVKTAAKVYFDKDIGDIDLNEAAFLMSLVQSPGEYSPLFSEDKEKALKLSNDRRSRVIGQVMENPSIVAYLNTNEKVYLEHHREDAANILMNRVNAEDQSNENKNKADENDNNKKSQKTKYDKEYFEKIKEKDLKFKPREEILRAPHWVFYIRDILLEDPYNLTREDLYTGGYRIHTTLDLSLQELVEKKLKEGIETYGPIYQFENGGLVAVDPRNGDVLAMVGSKGYYLPNNPEDRRFDPQVNVTTANQLLGSSLKPWVAYLAMQHLGFTGATTVKDEPTTFYGFYSPKNSDGGFFGEMTLRRALQDSRNIPFLRMSYQMGEWRLGEFMKEIGYKVETQYGLAAAIGGVNETLLDHTVAYTGLANGGDLMYQRSIIKITKSDGTLIHETDSKIRTSLNRDHVAAINSALGDKGYIPAGYNNHFKFVGNQKLAGKTGTSDRSRDTFYIGYSPKIVIGIWNGNNDNTFMRIDAFGSRTALPIWNGVMSSVLYEFPEYQEVGSY